MGNYTEPGPSRRAEVVCVGGTPAEADTLWRKVPNLKYEGFPLVNRNQ